MHRDRSLRRRVAMRIVLGFAATAVALAGAVMAFAFFSVTSPAETNTFSAAAVDHITITPSSSTITAGGSQSYAVTAFDVSNNSFGDVTSSTTFGISPDGSCTGSGCTTNVSGPHTVTATFWGLNVTSSLTVGSAGANKLVFTNPPSSSTGGVAFPSQPIVHVEDQFGNTVTSDTSQVSLAITAGTGASGASLTCNQASNHMNAVAGIAAFTGCAIDKASASTYTLTATDAPLTAAVSGQFTISVGAPAKVSITPAPTSATASLTTNVTVSLQLQDLGGNNTTASAGGLTVTLSTSSATGFFSAAIGGTGTLGGTFPVAFSSGVGTGTAFYGDETAATPTVTAKNGSSTWGAATVTITAGGPTKVAISPSPATAAASSTTNIALSLQLEDQFGNNATAGAGGVSLTVSSSSAKGFFATTSGVSGTLGGTITASFATGVGVATVFYGDETGGAPTITAKNVAATWGTTMVTINSGTAAGIVLTNIATQTAPPVTCSGSIGSVSCSSTGEGSNAAKTLVASIALADQFGNLVVNTSGTTKTLDLSFAGNGALMPSGVGALSIVNNASTSSAQFTFTRDNGSGKTTTMTATLHGTSQTLTVTLSS